MTEILQVVGAILILIPFAGVQRGWVGAQALSYLVLNLAGSIVLAWVALEEEDWGFLLLEAVWAVVSAWGLLELARGRPPSPAH
jgi:hypothetical protein